MKKDLQDSFIILGLLVLVIFFIYFVSLGFGDGLTGMIAAPVESAGVPLVGALDDTLSNDIASDNQITLSLHKGWNVLPITLDPDVKEIDQALASVINDAVVIREFAETDVYVYDPLIPSRFNTLQTIVGGKAYQIKMKNAASLTIDGLPLTDKSVTLHKGWNMMPYLGDEIVDVTETIEPIKSNIVVIREFGPDDVYVYDPSIPVRFNTLKQFKPDTGYMIKMFDNDKLVLVEPEPECVDSDEDGFYDETCEKPEFSDKLDCDDTNAGVYPRDNFNEKQNALCNDIDDDCDGTKDEECDCVTGLTQEVDCGDGVCQNKDALECVLGEWVPAVCLPKIENKVDENTVDLCSDGVDNDCDGMVDVLDSDCDFDKDDDGYVDENNNGDDCDDTSPQINPAASEVCDDTIDNDCDGMVDVLDSDCAAIKDDDNDGVDDSCDNCLGVSNPLQTNSDLVPKKEWDKTFGGVNWEMLFSLDQTSDNGYIIAGIILSPDTAMDALLVKIDSSGNKQWDKTFGGAGRDIGWLAQQTSDNGYIIAGVTASFGSGDDDVWLIKTDANGDEEWSKTFGAANNDGVMSVQQTTDNGYVLIGGTESFGSGGKDVWLIKTDVDGNKEWDKTFGGAGEDFARFVQQTSDNGYIITGETTSFGSGGKDVWLIKTDVDGNKEWDKTFGGTGEDLCEFVQQTSDSGYIMTGYTNSYGAGGEDIWLIKTDSAGNKEWDKTFGGTGNERSWSLDQTSDNGYIITGWTNSKGKGGNDVWVIKTGGDCNKQWDKTFGGTGFDFGTTVQQLVDESYIIGGYSDSFGAGGRDIWVIKTTKQGDAFGDECDFDNDNDGYDSVALGGDDCDDTSPQINPAASEICDDTIDNDCDDLVDSLDPDCVNKDVDNDGYDSVEYGGDDCYDEDASINPSAIEICDGIDNNCVGGIDEGCDCIDNAKQTQSCGVGACSKTIEQLCVLGKWDKQCVASSKISDEVCDNNLDDDCDGFTDSLDNDCDFDDDNDGFDALDKGGADCDDNNAIVNPGVSEVCSDSVDNDCDTLVDSLDNDCVLCGNNICEQGENFKTCEIDCYETQVNMSKTNATSYVVPSNESDVNDDLKKTTKLALLHDNKTIAKVKIHNTTEIDYINLSSVEIEKQKESDSKSYFILKGLNITNVSKIFYVEKKHPSSNAVCVKDQETAAISDVSSSCKGKNEIIVKCPGTKAEYVCQLYEKMFVVSGLKHSAVIEFVIPKPKPKPSVPSGGGGGSSGGGGGGGGGSGGGFVPKQCNDNIDNDGDKLFDLKDPGCTDKNDDNETDPVVVKPSCDDDKKNQDETGVDCGGVCDACEIPVNLCNNSILDQDEIGIDCGGVCDACEEITPEVHEPVKFMDNINIRRLLIVLFITLVIGFIILVYMRKKRKGHKKSKHHKKHTKHSKHKTNKVKHRTSHTKHKKHKKHKHHK